MVWWVLLSGLAHHGEAADPTLLEWVKETLDHIIGLGPWAVVLPLGLLIGKRCFISLTFWKRS